MSAPDPVPVSALSFDDVSVSRGGRLIWSQATFEVPAGGVIAVIGPNGSGKTTLLKMILGLVPPTSGRLTVFGREPGEDNVQIGYVPQNYAETPGEALRAVDTVLLGLVGNRWTPGPASAHQRERVNRALAEVEAEGFARERLSTLSGGQRQRVAIAEALVAEPRLLILDEPLAALDLRSQREIVVLLDRLHRSRGVTVLVVAHDINPLLPILDSAIYILDQHPHYAQITEVVDDDLLTHLYGTPIQVAHTAQGALYMRSEL